MGSRLRSDPNSFPISDALRVTLLPSRAHLHLGWNRAAPSADPWEPQSLEPNIFKGQVSQGFLPYYSALAVC
jgi:hypothetical protein